MLFLARFSYITFLFNFSFGTRDWNLDLPLRGKRSTTEPVLLLNDTVLLIATDSSFLIGKFRIKCLVSFFPLFFLLNNPSAFQKWSMVLIPSIYSFPWTVLTTSSFVWQWYHRIIICISSSSLLLLWLEIFLDIENNLFVFPWPSFLLNYYAMALWPDFSKGKLLSIHSQWPENT